MGASLQLVEKALLGKVTFKKLARHYPLPLTHSRLFRETTAQKIPHKSLTQVETMNSSSTNERNS